MLATDSTACAHGPCTCLERSAEAAPDQVYDVLRNPLTATLRVKSRANSTEEVINARLEQQRRCTVTPFLQTVNQAALRHHVPST